MKFSTTFENKVIGLLDANPSELDEEVAIASSSSNKTITWMKFVLTDSYPNGNNQMIPVDEFSTLVTSGINMPLKMEAGKIGDHFGATPLGVITNLSQEGNTIVALAALWGAERPEDVELLRSLFGAGVELYISWEVLYADSFFNEDNVEVLTGITFRAATIVKNPAYIDRTKVLAMSSSKLPRKWSNAYQNLLPDDSFLLVGIEGGGNKVRMYPFVDKDGKVSKRMLDSGIDKLRNSGLPMNVVKGAIKRAKKTKEILEDAKASIEMEEQTLETIEELRKEVEELKTSLSSLENTSQDEIKVLTEERDSLRKEVESLTEFKNNVEAEKARRESLQAIAAKFSAAGIEKDEDYFSENADVLLGYSEDAVDFMIREIVASGAMSNTEESSASTRVPNFIAEDDELDTTSLVNALLREEE